ncbi:MAG: hypothetical protein EB003_00155 [Flavobacteriia bacterium]|jgi:hypothetical protein|nr:hypothetical protein [Flavobacteriia bacterium]
MFISGNALNLLLNSNNMKTLRANQKLEQIIANVEKKGLEAPKLIEDLKELREMALLEQDPLVVKSLRLTYEFLQENECFDVEAQYEEDEEGNEYPIEIEDKENLLYFLNLLKNADHKINREEIKDYRSALKLELY